MGTPQADRDEVGKLMLSLNCTASFAEMYLRQQRMGALVERRTGGLPLHKVRAEMALSADLSTLAGIFERAGLDGWLEPAARPADMSVEATAVQVELGERIVAAALDRGLGHLVEQALHQPAAAPPSREEEICAICTLAGFAMLAPDFIAAKASLDDVRAALQRQRVAADEQLQIRPHRDAQLNEDDVHGRRAATLLPKSAAEVSAGAAVVAEAFADAQANAQGGP